MSPVPRIFFHEHRVAVMGLDRDSQDIFSSLNCCIDQGHLAGVPSVFGMSSSTTSSSSMGRPDVLRENFRRSRPSTVMHGPINQGILVIEVAHPEVSIVWAQLLEQVLINQEPWPGLWNDLFDFLKVHKAESCNGELGTPPLPVDLRLPAQTVQNIVQQLEARSFHMDPIVEPERGID